MKLYYFPTPNPQKIKFALLELGLDCETVPVDLTKQEHREAAFLALNPYGRVPVFVDDDVTLWESHAILAYLGEKIGRLWPALPAGRATALKWLFFLSAHVAQPAGEVALRIRAKLLGIPAEESVIARGERALPGVLEVVERQIGHNEWLLGTDFSLVDCAYGPILNVIEKSGFDLSGFPNAARYLASVRSRAAWKETPKLPPLA